MILMLLAGLIAASVLGVLYVNGFVAAAACMKRA